MTPADGAKRILITGGAGFIGSRLALALRARGHDVTVLDNLSPQIHTADPEHSACTGRSPERCGSCAAT